MPRSPQTRWIPQGSRPFTRTEGTDAVVYFHESTNKVSGRVSYCAIAYHGKANQPDFYRSYISAKIRAEDVASYINGRKARAKMMADRRAEKNEPHSLQVGDILKESWGYDQTNIDYYEVTRVISPHTVEIREIAQETVETGFMSGNCSPLSGKYVGEAMIKRAGKDNCVKIRDWGSWAHKVEKLDVARWSAYA